MATRKKDRDYKLFLRERIEDNHKLDLSLSELSADILPVSDMDSFIKLNHIVSLDLSQNQLISLPENFGKLINLERLDLYKNRLDSFPISFGSLKRLKWLDVKDNPLDPELNRAAGDCLDDKQCRTAAINVVKYMQSVQSEIEVMKQKKQQKEKDMNETIRAAEAKRESALQQQSKKEKENKKAQKKAKRQQEMEKISRQKSEKEARYENNSKEHAVNGRVKQSPQKMMQAATRRQRGLCGRVLSWVWSILLVSLVIFGLSGLMVYTVCSQRSDMSQVGISAKQRDQFCTRSYDVFIKLPSYLPTNLRIPRPLVIAGVNFTPFFDQAHEAVTSLCNKIGMQVARIEWHKLGDYLSAAASWLVTKGRLFIDWCRTDGLNLLVAMGLVVWETLKVLGDYVRYVLTLLWKNVQKFHETAPDALQHYWVELKTFFTPSASKA